MSHPSSSPPLLNACGGGVVNDVNANLNPAKPPTTSLARPDSGRKLTRSESTFGEDIFDESLHELSRLNQRHVLRQQWFRKNNLVSRLRRSTSTASNSSSSSSSTASSSSSAMSSSGIYSSSATNTSSSFASSFSSSFATLSSLSESCDTGDCPANHNPPAPETPDYPRILRRCSFKNKFSSCYKPYYKPRRLSLQLLKQGNQELPENFRYYPSAKLQQQQSQGYFDASQTINPPAINSGFVIRRDKENSMYDLSGSTKSNPASPNKHTAVRFGSDPSRGDCCVRMAACDVQASSMQAAQQVVITTATTNSGTDSSASQGTSQLGPMPGGQSGQQSCLVRSKSLDDLNTLLYPSLPPYASTTTEMDSNTSGAMGSGVLGAVMATANTHYASFNRIFADAPNCAAQSMAPNYCGQSGPPSLAPQPPTFGDCGQFGGGVGGSNTLSVNTTGVRGMSYSSHEIYAVGNQPPTNQAQPLNGSVNNASLCDIDNVMKKISSLRV